MHFKLFIIILSVFTLGFIVGNMHMLYKMYIIFPDMFKLEYITEAITLARGI